MKIVIGCDHAGFGIKDAVKKHIEEMGHEVTDVGTYSTDSCHYPIYASAACKKILDGECELGILICGTGIGISLAANKVKGIRAAVCSDAYSASMTRRHNNSNILAFGSRVVGQGTAETIVDAFLGAEYEGGRHQTRVDMVMEIENEQ